MCKSCVNLIPASCLSHHQDIKNSGMKAQHYTRKDVFYAYIRVLVIHTDFNVFNISTMTIVKDIVGDHSG